MAEHTTPTGESKPMIQNIAIWLSAEDAAAYLGVSRDTIEQYAIPWPKDDKQVPGRWRWKNLSLKQGSKPRRRYFRPDLDSSLN
jgi:hypothetical protein